MRLGRRRHGPSLREFRALRPIALRAGYHLVRADYYSPIPDLGRLPNTLFSQPAPMPDIDWDLDAQLAFLSSGLAGFVAEFDAELSAAPTSAFRLDNPYFGPQDAEILYAVLRWGRPARVLELGSGFSSLVIARAAARNEADGAPLTHELYDPFPSPLLEEIRDRVGVNAQPASAIPAHAFAELKAGDVLFIDTTHTVKPGGEVTRLMLEVLPELAPGVLIHIHDFFRPFEYPRVLFEKFGVYWQEHHLVQAFLAFNDEFEILCANHALSRLRGDAVRALVPSLNAQMQPSSLWLRRR